MKKAQVETIGLVVIVALLAFILVFVLQISLQPKQNTLQSRYMQLNADNLRSSLLKTTLCQDTNLREEILSCNDFSQPTCSNLNSCEDLENTIKTIIENSLNVTRNYKFEAGNILVSKGTCKNTFTATQEPIPNSNIVIKLEIC